MNLKIEYHFSSIWLNRMGNLNSIHKDIRKQYKDRYLTKKDQLMLCAAHGFKINIGDDFLNYAVRN
jgi:hypothetical protein